MAACTCTSTVCNCVGGVTTESDSNQNLAAIHMVILTPEEIEALREEGLLEYKLFWHWLLSFALPPAPAPAPEDKRDDDSLPVSPWQPRLMLVGNPPRAPPNWRPGCLFDKPKEKEQPMGVPIVCPKCEKTKILYNARAPFPVVRCDACEASFHVSNAKLLTVGDLIVKLQEFDQDLPVVLNGYEGDYDSIAGVGVFPMVFFSQLDSFCGAHRVIQRDVKSKKGLRTGQALFLSIGDKEQEDDYLEKHALSQKSLDTVESWE